LKKSQYALLRNAVDENIAEYPSALYLQTLAMFDEGIEEKQDDANKPAE
jgi:hypothetical protein